MHQHIPKNDTGRDFVVGDIHGCYDLLMDKLAYEGFNKTNDRLFSVGDLIDRGPDSEKCLDLLNKPWFHMVRGNHEAMMIDACRSGRGGHWLTSYGVWARHFDIKEMDEWASLLEKCPISLTLQMDGFSVGICHAEPDGTDWTESRDSIQSTEPMMWGRRVLRGKVRGEVQNIDFTVHGHTPVEFPTWVDNRYFMDTGAWYSGELTVRKIDDIWGEWSARKSLC